MTSLFEHTKTLINKEGAINISNRYNALIAEMTGKGKDTPLSFDIDNLTQADLNLQKRLLPGLLVSGALHEIMDKNIPFPSKSKFLNSMVQEVITKHQKLCLDGWQQTADSTQATKRVIGKKNRTDLGNLLIFSSIWHANTPEDLKSANDFMLTIEHEVNHPQTKRMMTLPKEWVDKIVQGEQVQRRRA